MAVIDADAANDRGSTANTAVPAEFAGFLAVERFIGNAGLNKSEKMAVSAPLALTLTLSQRERGPINGRALGRKRL
ncbi:MAG: hypothetical protein JXB10_11875 [Pirellulales bacterium]|nr:hypothetical protein [Pirellulales bacterium]